MLIDRDAILAEQRILSAPERELRQMLADLHREYQERARPIVAALAHYEATRIMPPLMLLANGAIDLDAIKALGLNSREHSEQLLAEHRAQHQVDPPSRPGGG